MYQLFTVESQGKKSKKVDAETQMFYPAFVSSDELTGKSNQIVTLVQ